MSLGQVAQVAHAQPSSQPTKCLAGSGDLSLAAGAGVAAAMFTTRAQFVVILARGFT